jgi:3-hydroxyacyl-[acyl-carrier-protein] dehydratase
MLLENKFYKVLSEERGEGLCAKYHVAILPECNVYDGHFPGDPVCPGVCNIETIKECAILLCGEQLRYSTIKQCRLTALATPTVCPEVDVQVTLTPAGDSYSVQATIADAKQTYMILKGQLDKA